MIIVLIIFGIVGMFVVDVVIIKGFCVVVL